MSNVTAAVARKVLEAHNAQWDAEHACPNCPWIMEYVCRLSDGTSQSCGTSLYQCPKCKTVKEL
jgi:hypothetical protein